MLNRDPFEHLDDLGKEWIGDFGNDQAENAASSGNERACLSVRIVAKFFDDVPDPLGELRIDCGNPINGAGYGRGGDSCALCDFTDIHELVARACRLQAEIISRTGNRLRTDFI